VRTLRQKFEGTGTTGATELDGIGVSVGISEVGLGVMVDSLTTVDVSLVELVEDNAEDSVLARDEAVEMSEEVGVGEKLLLLAALSDGVVNDALDVDDELVVIADDLELSLGVNEASLETDDEVE
jgi:hypothetical protein